MSAVRIGADREVCVGAGQCALRAPQLFDQDDEGIVLVLVPEPAAADHGAARLAVDLCPSSALSLDD